MSHLMLQSTQIFGASVTVNCEVSSQSSIFANYALLLSLAHLPEQLQELYKYLFFLVYQQRNRVVLELVLVLVLVLAPVGFLLFLTLSCTGTLKYCMLVPVLVP